MSEMSKDCGCDGDLQCECYDKLKECLEKSMAINDAQQIELARVKAELEHEKDHCLATARKYIDQRDRLKAELKAVIIAGQQLVGKAYHVLDGTPALDTWRFASKTEKGSSL